MPDRKLMPDERVEVLTILRHGIERSLLLAHSLAGNPLVAAEARSLKGQLQSIQAEVDAIASFRERRPPDYKVSSGPSIPIWE